MGRRKCKYFGATLFSFKNQTQDLLDFVLHFLVPVSQRADAFSLLSPQLRDPSLLTPDDLL